MKKNKNASKARAIVGPQVVGDKKVSSEEKNTALLVSVVFVAPLVGQFVQALRFWSQGDSVGLVLSVATFVLWCVFLALAVLKGRIEFFPQKS